MNIALITAGGIGSRAGCNEPKQFTRIAGKPVIVHTLEKFEHHPEIDIIAVSCLEGWEKRLRGMASEFCIGKLKHILPGGATNQLSIRNGVDALANLYSSDDIILVHDAVRPLVSKAVVSDCLRVVREKGNAIACVPCVEPLLRSINSPCAAEAWLSRDALMRAQAPQGFFLGRLADAHRKAVEKNITDCVASCELMLRLGETVYLSRSETTNIKITTAEDMAVAEALLTELSDT